MAYAILRVEKIKTNASGYNDHLERNKEIKNANPKFTNLNQRYIGSGDLNQDIQKRIKEIGCKVRKNAVLGLDYMLTASPEFFQEFKEMKKKGTNKSQWEEFNEKKKVWVKANYQWLEKRHGKENIINLTLHMDEETPHLHAVVVPELNGKLNAKEILGNNKKMSAMQDEYAENMARFELKRGVKKSRAKHKTVREFYGMLDEEALKVEKFKPEPYEFESFTTLDRLNPQNYFERQNKAILEHISLQIEKQYDEGEKKAKLNRLPTLREELAKSRNVDYDNLKEENEELRDNIHDLRKEHQEKLDYIYTQHTILLAQKDEEFEKKTAALHQQNESLKGKNARLSNQLTEANKMLVDLRLGELDKKKLTDYLNKHELVEIKRNPNLGRSI